MSLGWFDGWVMVLGRGGMGMWTDGELLQVL